MKVTGIVAEYNPFHNGHKYQLEFAKEHLSSDYNVVVMSGDWVQRGAPAIYDKYSRAEVALKNGADMVIELPLIYSIASAEGFAKSAISLLNHTGIVNQLLFGGESTDLKLFSKASSILANEPDEFQTTLREKLSQGLSYPLARDYALRSCLTLPEEFLSSPNNILGLEYCKALLTSDSSITPFVNKRIQNEYHDISIESNFASATAIRHVITKRAIGDESVSDVPELLSHVMPDESVDQASSLVPIIREDFSLLLNKALFDNAEYFNFTDCTDDISNKILNNRNSFESWKQFAELLKSKDLTHTRISRVLSHILLNVTDDLYNLGASLDYAPYLRVLGWSKKGSELLPILKENCDIPIITTVSDAKDNLSPRRMQLLQKDIYAADIYSMVVSNKTGVKHSNEYTRKFDLVGVE